MLARKSLSKTKILILAGLMVVIWGAIGILLYKNFGSSSPAPAVVTIPGAVNPTTATQVPPSTVGSLEVLRDPRLINLKVYGDVPLEVKVIGRTNPFEQIKP